MNLVQRIAGRTPGDVRAGFIERRFLWIDHDVALSDAHWDRSRHPSDRTAFSDHPSIVFIREGTYIKSVGRSRAVGDPTQVTLYDGKLEVGIRHPRGDRVRGTTFLLTPDLLRRMFSEAGLPLKNAERPFGRLSAPVSSEAHLLYQRIVRYLSDDPAPDEAVTEEAVHRLLGLVLRDTYGGRAPSRRRRRRMRRRMVDVQASLAAQDPPRTRLADLARTLGCSPEYASRVFADATGMPMSKYLLRLRLRRAAARLLEGETDLAGLALAVGFAGHSHFTAAFTREFGSPPSVVRSTAHRERMLHVLRET